MTQYQNNTTDMLAQGDKANLKSAAILDCLFILDDELESFNLESRIISSISETEKIHNLIVRRLSEAKSLDLAFVNPDCVFLLVHQNGRISDGKLSNLRFLEDKFGKF